MSLPPQLGCSLTRSENLAFAENIHTLTIIDTSKERFVASPVASGTLWHLPESSPDGLRVLVAPTGHAVLYGEHGLRILYLDPGGTPLHECAWETSGNTPRLLRARLQLDWGQWVGIKPEGIINSARFDISKRSGWQCLTREDLQRMAAQAMGVTADEVAVFYDADSLTLDAHGQVTVKHRKDALYVLRDGRFETAQFMACMGAMHWGQIDFLPVVELFQSLLAGTGSAVFELIRGLYDDQNEAGRPRPLRYRGIPTYPSPQAFQLFSTYFIPEASGGDDPLSIFMEPTRSAEVIWRPRPDVPQRFTDPEQRLCVTAAAGSVQKVTVWDDPVALPFGRPKGHRLPSGGRVVAATKKLLQLQDGDQRVELTLKPEWGITKESSLPGPLAHQTTWRSLFPEGPPKIDARQAYFAAPMYPDDDSLVDESGTQSVAMEQIGEYLDKVKAGGDVLIDQWDVVTAECLETVVARSCLVLYKWPEFAQRQAQKIWDHAAASGGLSKISHVQMRPATESHAAYDRRYDFIFRWIPFGKYTEQKELDKILQEVAEALTTGGHLILAGPGDSEKAAGRAGLTRLASCAITETSGAGMLRSILPHARIRPDATLFLLRKCNL